MADLTPIQIFSSGTGDSTASLDVPSDGEIKAVAWIVGASGMDADADLVQAEVSFGSSNQFGTNDSRSVIAAAEIRVSAATVASIANTSLVEHMDFGGDGVPVAAGERIHLHITRSTGVSANVKAILYMRLRGAGRALPRRSR